jgi:hypothetical protein
VEEWIGTWDLFTFPASSLSLNVSHFQEEIKRFSLFFAKKRSFSSKAATRRKHAKPPGIQIAVFSEKRLENRLSWIYILSALI